MAQPLTPRALAFLASAGWSQDRRMDPAYFESRLKAQGHVLVPAAARFLSRFGLLTFVRTSPYRPSVTLLGHTDPVEAGARLSPGELAVLRREAGSRLTPIGQWGYGDFIMVMDGRGRAWGVNDQTGQLMEWTTPREPLFNTLCLGVGPET